MSQPTDSRNKNRGPGYASITEKVIPTPDGVADSTAGGLSEQMATGAAAGYTDDAGTIMLDTIYVTANSTPLDEQSFIGDPVSLSSGEEVLSLTDATLPGLDGLSWSRLYRSCFCDHATSLGKGWRSPYHVSIQEETDREGSRLIYTNEEGRAILFENVRSGGVSYQRGEGLRLNRDFKEYRQDDELTLYFPDGHIKVFTRQPGQNRQKQIQHWHLSRWVTAETQLWLFTYNQQNQLGTIVQEGSQQQVRLAYDPEGRLISVLQVTPAPRPDAKPLQYFLARYSYNEKDELISATNQYEQTERYDYQDGLLITRTQASGYQHHLVWQGEGPTARVIEQYGDNKSFYSRLEFDEAARITTAIAGDESRWEYHYDAHWKLIKQVAPDGGCDEFSYDDYLRLTRHKDASGQVHHYEYNDLGQLVREEQGNYWLEHRYNSLGQRISTRDELGEHFTRTFDAAGKLISDNKLLSSDAQGGLEETRYHYDKTSLQLARVEQSGKADIQFQFDVPNRTSKTPNFFNEPSCPLLVKQGEATWRYRYNLLGRLDGLLTPTQEVINYHYNKQGLLGRHSRFLAGAEAHAETTEYRYDDAGRLTAVIAPDGTTEQVEYEGFAEPKALIQADESNLHLCYNAQRQLTGLLRSDHAFSRFHYDSCQRLTRTEHFDERQRGYRWSQDGKLIEITEGKSGYPSTVRIQLNHDTRGNMTQRDAQSYSHDSSTSDHFQYDVRNRLTEAFNPQARVKIYWNTRNQKTGAEGWINDRHGDMHPWKIEHSFDRHNRLESTTLPDGTRISHHYDSHHRLEGVSVNDARVLNRRTNVYGSEVLREIPAFPAPLLTQQYDHRDRLIRQSWQHNEQPRHREYRYGAHQQLSQVEDSATGSAQYAYDALRQLREVSTSGQTQNYRFDSWGNPLEFAGQAAEATFDKLTMLGEQRYSHDELGNQSEVHDASGKLLQRRLFDGLNQLREVITDSVHARYDYDSFGRRVRKEVLRFELVLEGDDENDPENWTRRILGKNTTFFYWDGNQLIGENRDGQSRWYIYEPQPEDQQQRSHRPLMMIEGSNIYHYVLDQRGAPIALLDNQGQLAWEAQLDAWGHATVLHENVDNPLRLQGQYADKESGLHYNRYRYYDPTQGRFITQDPIGLLGGLNPYRYAPNPLSWADPLGLCTEAACLGTEPSLAASAGSLTADMLPVVGSLKSLAQVFTGSDLVTGEPVSRWMEGAGILLGMIPGGKALLKGKKALKLADKALGGLNTAQKALGDIPKVTALNRADLESKLVEKLGRDIKDNPLRKEYEQKVAELSRYQLGLTDHTIAEKALANMANLPGSEKVLAETANNARRQLGVEYKNLTPEPLRDYIYDVNMKRYGDPLGPGVDLLVQRGKTYSQIVESAARPNPDVNSLLGGFGKWLSKQPEDYLQKHMNLLSGSN
ncbi:RHS repeat-associated core domain-containing protein [Pokkaliibacter sp. CJK22405]|uniref:RHS repeat-associated core domain-containing protein n=1 Tax=Pokkaliibacter sp. CJK22405 TaxID=3384615 RepID=UPI00398537B4